MKIHIDFQGRDKASGPHMFTRRLEYALGKIEGVEMSSDHPDISLGVINLPKKRGKKNIVRIDGCYYNEAIGKIRNNASIADAIKRADGVIFQSEFSKKLCRLILGVKSKSKIIIPNGIDQSLIRSIQAAPKISEHVFVAAANWRMTKRPKSIIRSFRRANIPNSKLIFIGDYQEKVKHPDILYTGDLREADVISYLKSATALIHLCMIESCPNIVVEALSAGVPVICNNIGGTPELVKSDGIIVECDDPFDFRIINNNNVDNLDEEKLERVAQAMRVCVNKKWSINRPELDISQTAIAYHDFFKWILK